MFSGNHQLLPAPTASAPVAELFAQSLSERKYTILNRIARGGFGVVYKAIDLRRNQPVALKCALMQEQTGELEAEYSYQRMVAHENVAKAYALFRCENGQDVMAVEYADGGTLTDLFIEHPRPFTETQARTLFRQVVRGVAHLHSIGMAHRDIKPDNILIFDGVLKISDFGLSCWADARDTFEERNRRVGTQEYAAPEMFDAHVLISDPRPADIYSLAQIFCELLVGCTVHDLQESDLHLMSDDADDLLSLMLEDDPVRRITAQEILNHPWFSGCKEDKALDCNMKKKCSLQLSSPRVIYTESSPL